MVWKEEIANVSLMKIMNSMSFQSRKPFDRGLPAGAGRASPDQPFTRQHMLLATAQGLIGPQSTSMAPNLPQVRAVLPFRNLHRPYRHRPYRHRPYPRRRPRRNRRRQNRPDRPASPVPATRQPRHHRDHLFTHFLPASPALPGSRGGSRGCSPRGEKVQKKQKENKKKREDSPPDYTLAGTGYRR